jgi:hypothetical protein
MHKSSESIDERIHARYFIYELLILFKNKKNYYIKIS